MSCCWCHQARHSDWRLVVIHGPPIFWWPRFAVGGGRRVPPGRIRSRASTGALLVLQGRRTGRRWPSVPAAAGLGDLSWPGLDAVGVPDRRPAGWLMTARAVPGPGAQRGESGRNSPGASATAGRPTCLTQRRGAVEEPARGRDALATSAPQLSAVLELAGRVRVLARAIFGDHRVPRPRPGGADASSASSSARPMVCVCPDV